MADEKSNNIVKLVLIRHGESVWNKANLFTGWTDVDLTDTGVNEARTGGKSLAKEGFEFDIAFTSVLKRAIKTLFLVQDELDQHWIPVVRHWRLNERHYGALQGLNKAETAAKHGEDQVKIWRRSYDVPPPALKEDDERFPGKDKRYASLEDKDLPRAECLKDTVERFLPLWHADISENVKAGKRVLIVAHGNSLRALVKHLDNISDQDIVGLNIPTGIPLVYELDQKTLQPVKHYYLADADAVAAAEAAVANQGKAK